MSSGFKTHSMPTIADTDTLPSLVLSAAIWEWQSMMPGITNCPDASIVLASAGSITFSPTPAILPSRIRIDPLTVPLVTVRMVAFLMTIGGAASTDAANAQVMITVGQAILPAAGFRAGAFGSASFIDFLPAELLLWDLPLWRSRRPGRRVPPPAPPSPPP